MSRGPVEDLASPHPLGERLPAIYQGDLFAQGLTAALDQVLAPIFSTLDNLDSYLDPRLAPADFLAWLGAWVGMVLDESLPPERQRVLVGEAAALYRVRGTARGLARHLEIVTGARVEIEESGGTAWYTTSSNPPPGRPGYELVVRVYADDPASVDLSSVDARVAAFKPAHVLHRVELLGSGPVKTA